MGFNTISFDTEVVELFRALRLEINYKTNMKISNSDLLRHACKLIREEIDAQEAAQKENNTESNNEHVVNGV